MPSTEPILSNQSEYLGSDLYASDIRENQHFGLASSGSLSEVLSSPDTTLLPGRGHARPDRTQIESGNKLIGLLHPFSLFEELLHRLFLANHTFTVASPFFLGALPSVREVLERESNPKDEKENDLLSLKICENTFRPMHVPASITASNFHTLFTGQNLRWEFIGFVFALAGRCASIKPAHSTIFVNDDGEAIGRNRFVHEMMIASRTCIAMCRQNGETVNDVLIWLLYENLVFSTQHYGDSSMNSSSMERQMFD